MYNSSMRIRKSHEIDRPNAYIRALHGEYSRWAFSENRAMEMRGRWRELAFMGPAHLATSGAPDSTPLDLEIGTGNGFFFAHRAAAHPTRLLVGVELKFKPLIQSIRRVLTNGCQNARIVRYHAANVGDLFTAGEVNDVFVHHPDPWERPRKHKHRLLKREYLSVLFDLQRRGSRFEFKTDSEDYFRWAKKEFDMTNYLLERYTEDLHSSEWASENFVTHFESIFIKKGLPIYYMRFLRS